MLSWFEERHFRADTGLENTRLRMNVIFWGCVLINMFCIVLFTMISDIPLKLSACFHGLTLWSLMGIIYSFYGLSGATIKAKEYFRRRSLVDQITGVFNYRYLELRLSEEEERTSRYGGLTTVLYVDLDQFKPVNDRFGHQVGDTVLGDIASAMAARVRVCDVFGRMGGDEFLAVLPQTDRRQAEILAERLRQAVADYQLDLADGQRIDFVRASIGIAAYPINGESMRDVIAAADAAVYEAKRRGGDTVCMAEEFVGTQDSEESFVAEVRGRKVGR